MIKFPRSGARRDRAFFSALRCLLSEINTERNPQERDTKLRALVYLGLGLSLICTSVPLSLMYICTALAITHVVCRPRGSHIDASTSAVLATSLSIPAKPIPGAPPAATHQHRSDGVFTPISGQATKDQYTSPLSGVARCSRKKRDSCASSQCKPHSFLKGVGKSSLHILCLSMRQVILEVDNPMF
eukprot:scaffold79846_cov15-Tisochrysis_lutea.AAC.2